MANNDRIAKPLTIARVGFAFAVVIAIVFGYIGLWTFVHGPRGTAFGRSVADVFYYDLQLFVLGSAPVDAGGPFPAWLDIARFLAPAATLYALFEAARALLASGWRQWRQRRMTGHAIVVGDSPVSRAIAAKVRAYGQHAVEVRTADADALAAAGLVGAAVVYACADAGNGTASLATALAAAQTRTSTPLRVYTQIDDTGLALALRARRLRLPAGGDQLHLDFFSVEELAARALLAAEDLDVPSDVATVHILIAGLGTFGRTVLIEFARQWQLRSPRRAERVLVTMVDAKARQIAAEIAARWDVVASVCTLNPVESGIDDALRAAGNPPPHRVYLCWDDEELALRTALTATQLWSGGTGSVVVRLNRLAGNRAAFRGEGPPLLDDLGGRLQLVGVTELGCEPNVIQEDLVERLAQAIHDRYLVEQLRAGRAMGSSDAMGMWANLPDGMRSANRAQARDIGTKLSLVRCTVAPRDTGVQFAFQPEELKRLAEQEHRRWVAERRQSGWTYAPTRDDAAKRHPSLVAWDALTESERDKDREAVRNLPQVLADAGLQIVRLDPLTTSPRPGLA